MSRSITDSIATGSLNGFFLIAAQNDHMSRRVSHALFRFIGHETVNVQDHLWIACQRNPLGFAELIIPFFYGAGWRLKDSLSVARNLFSIERALSAWNSRFGHGTGGLQSEAKHCRQITVWDRPRLTFSKDQRPLG